MQRKFCDRCGAEVTASHYQLVVRVEGPMDLCEACWRSFDEWRRPRPPRRRRLMHPELLAEVAEVAASNPDRPNRAIMERFGVGYRTAARWASLSRGSGK